MISSPTNAKIKHGVRVRDGQEHDLVFVEGERLVEDLLLSDWRPQMAFHGPDPSERALSAIQQLDCEVHPTSNEVIRKLASTVSSQGIIVIAHKPPAPVLEPADGLFIALDSVQDPGNAGTILRTAEAAGVAGAVFLDGCVDPFSPKALRASMGSAFRMPILRLGSDALLHWCKQHQVILAAAAGGAVTKHTDADWKRPTMLVLGNEANGVSQALLEACDLKVRIPLKGRVESLNVAAAAAVILFEASRQRGF